MPGRRVATRGLIGSDAMYQLTIRGPDGSEVQYNLGLDEGLIVGRDADCDIVLPSKRVSRRHARFFTQGESLHLEDLGSQNGVFVGGGRVQGTEELRPGPPIEIGEFKIRVKRVDPRAVPTVDASTQASGEAHLKGLGAQQGRSLALPKERGHVGRDASMEVTVDDDSVSRKHAEIRVEAGVYVVRDLGSSNGTFVNGTRLKTGLDKRLAHDDKLRFGETHWIFVGGPAQQAAGGLPPRTKKLLAAVAVLVVFFGVAFVVKGGAGGGGEETTELTAEELVQEALGRGQSALEADQLTAARDAFKEALQHDPVNREARLLLRKVDEELEYGALLKEATAKAEVGKDQDAMNLIFKIDPSSRFYPRARMQIAELTPSLVRKASAACREATRSRKWNDVLEHCTRLLDVKCHTGEDAAALHALKDAEKALKVRDPWTCPARLAPWFGAGGQGTDSGGALNALFPDKEIRDAVASYVNGEAEKAQKALAKLQNGKLATRADELRDKVLVVDGRFKEGQSALNAGNFKDAEAAYKIALEADRFILQGKAESFVSKQMRTALAKEYFTLGKGQFDRQRWVESYTAWAKGLDYVSNDSQLLDGMGRLEKRAEEQLSNGTDCAGLDLILASTLATSGVHAKAKSAAEECE